MTHRTSDLCDEYSDILHAPEPIFGDFGGITFTRGHYLYADLDGFVVSPKELNANYNAAKGSAVSRRAVWRLS